MDKKDGGAGPGLWIFFIVLAAAALILVLVKFMGRGTAEYRIPSEQTGSVQELQIFVEIEEQVS